MRILFLFTPRLLWGFFSPYLSSRLLIRGLSLESTGLNDKEIEERVGRLVITGIWGNIKHIVPFILEERDRDILYPRKKKKKKDCLSSLPTIVLTRLPRKSPLLHPSRGANSNLSMFADSPNGKNPTQYQPAHIHPKPSPLSRYPPQLQRRQKPATNAPNSDALSYNPPSSAEHSFRPLSSSSHFRRRLLRWRQPSPKPRWKMLCKAKGNCLHVAQGAEERKGYGLAFRMWLGESLGIEVGRERDRGCNMLKGWMRSQGEGRFVPRVRWGDWWPGRML